MAVEPMDKEELELIHANFSKIMAETMKLGAETARIQKEIRFYPMVALGTIAVTGLAALATLVIALIKFL